MSSLERLGSDDVSTGAREFLNEGNIQTDSYLLADNTSFTFHLYCVSDIFKDRKQLKNKLEMRRSRVISEECVCNLTFCFYHPRSKRTFFFGMQCFI